MKTKDKRKKIKGKNGRRGEREKLIRINPCDPW
jgi:hypothetical protein